MTIEKFGKSPEPSKPSKPKRNLRRFFSFSLPRQQEAARTGRADRFRSIDFDASGQHGPEGHSLQRNGSQPSTSRGDGLGREDNPSGSSEHQSESVEQSDHPQQTHDQSQKEKYYNLFKECLASRGLEKSIDVISELVQKFPDSKTNAVEALHMLTAECLSNGEYKKAIKWTEGVVRICKQMFERPHLQTARALLGQGYAQIGLDNVKKAGEICQEAFGIYEQLGESGREEAKDAERCSYLGQKLGNNRLVGNLGRGGFSYVYLGEYQETLQLSSQIAVKVLQKRGRENQEMRQDFINEVKVLEKLKNPNIVRLIEYDIEGTIPFMVLEYAPNGTLPKEGCVPLSEIIPSVLQMADAVDYLHRNHLMHLDIKHDNFLLGADGRVLLTDFGTARSETEGPFDKVGGTVAYMAPEHIDGNPCTRSDVYSFGVLLFKSLTDKYPFGESLGMVMESHDSWNSSGEFHEELRERITSKGYSGEIADVILQALSTNPEDRHDSAGTFVMKLELAWHRQESQTDKKKIAELEHRYYISKKIIEDLLLPAGKFTLENKELQSAKESMERLKTDKEQLQIQVKDLNQKNQTLQQKNEELERHIRDLLGLLQ